METLPDFRQLGLSRAVISAALRGAKGYEFGFEPLGIESRFLRVVDV